MKTFTNTLTFISGLAFVTSAASVSLHADNKIPADCEVGGFAIGTIVYTFDRFSLFEALEKTAECGSTVVELSAKTSLSREEPNVPFDYHASPETIQKVKAKLARCKLKAVNYAVIPFPAEEAKGRKLFEFARAMGIRAITTESPELIDRMEKLVKEYDIMIALHDHTRRPNDPGYRRW